VPTHAGFGGDRRFHMRSENQTEERILSTTWDAPGNRNQRCAWLGENKSPVAQKPGVRKLSVAGLIWFVHTAKRTRKRGDQTQILHAYENSAGKKTEQEVCWNRPSTLLPINRRRRTPARRSRSNGIRELVCAANDLAAFSVFSPFYYAKSTSKHAYN
jgi:hypothetical protein